MAVRGGRNIPDHRPRVADLVQWPREMRRQYLVYCRRISRRGAAVPLCRKCCASTCRALISGYLRTAIKRPSRRPPGALHLVPSAAASAAVALETPLLRQSCPSGAIHLISCESSRRLRTCVRARSALSCCLATCRSTSAGGQPPSTDSIQRNCSSLRRKQGEPTFGLGKYSALSPKAAAHFLAALFLQCYLCVVTVCRYACAAPGFCPARRTARLRRAL